MKHFVTIIGCLFLATGVPGAQEVINDRLVIRPPEQPVHVIQILNSSGSSAPAQFTIDAGSNGRIRINDSTSSPKIDLNAAGPTVLYGNNLILNGGRLGIGTNNPSAPLVVQASTTPQHAIRVNNQNNTSAVVTFTVESSGGGQLRVQDATNTNRIQLDAQDSSWINGGNFGIGTTTPSVALDVIGSIRAQHEVSAGVIEIRGEGNDLAEGFRIANSREEILPGMVVSISKENPGELQLSRDPYDKTVAGIISGAGGKHVGLQLGHAEEVARGELYPVALAGRVWCYVDADKEAVEPGDLLTTSATLGHAMKVTDHERAYGAKIGKALTPLDCGKGLVLVLITLH